MLAATAMLVATSSLSAQATGGSPGGDERPGIDQLAWLAGAWVHSEHPDGVQEAWLPPRGGIMLGVHRDTRASRPFFEYLRIEETREGDATQVVYFASPLGRPATAFRMTASSAGHVRFENADHDFPRRIEYARDGDRLTMTASGPGRTERWTMVLDPSTWR